MKSDEKPLTRYEAFDAWAGGIRLMGLGTEPVKNAVNQPVYLCADVDPVLTEKEAEIAELTNIVTLGDQLVRERDSANLRMYEALTAKDAQISELEKALAEARGEDVYHPPGPGYGAGMVPKGEPLTPADRERLLREWLPALKNLADLEPEEDVNDLTKLYVTRQELAHILLNSFMLMQDPEGLAHRHAKIYAERLKCGEDARG